LLDEQRLHYTQSGEDVKFFFGIFPDDLRQVDGDEIDQPLLDQWRLLVCVVERLPTANGVLSGAILLTCSRRRQGSLVQAMRAGISFSWRNFFSFLVLPHATLSSAKGEGSVGARIVCRSSEQTLRLGDWQDNANTILPTGERLRPGTRHPFQEGQLVRTVTPRAGDRVTSGAFAWRIRG